MTPDPQPPLPAASWTELQYFLLVAHCQRCGKGPLQAGPAETQDSDRALLATTCRACGDQQQFLFAVATPPGESANPVEPINPTNHPSRLIDLAQWMSLFYLFVEQASQTPDKPASRRLGYQGAMCLAEALKFYGDDDQLPPAEAFFTPAGRKAFRQHPEKFARQRLRDMQAKLPPLPTMAERVHRDLGRGETPAPRPARKWWQVWKRS